jgi:FKBP-type peptidyl-prolyl cis-trans isomerase SlyD
MDSTTPCWNDAIAGFCVKLTEVRPRRIFKGAAMRKLPTMIFGALVFSLFLAAGAVTAQENKNDTVVKDGMLVSLQYTLSGEDGKMIESNRDKEPLGYVQGQHMVIPGLEKELTGMKVGQEKHVVVKPEDAYGAVDPKRYQEFPQDRIPPEVMKQLKVGSMIPLTAPNGQTYNFPVSEIKENTIVVNLNHPMAGKTLVFDIKVLDIKPAPSPPSSPSATPAKPAAPK